GRAHDTHAAAAATSACTHADASATDTSGLDGETAGRCPASAITRAGDRTAGDARQYSGRYECQGPGCRPGTGGRAQRRRNRPVRLLLPGVRLTDAGDDRVTLEPEPARARHDRTAVHHRPRRIDRSRQHYGDPAKRLWRAGSQLDARAPGRAAAAAAGGVPEPDADRQADFSLRNVMKITTTRSLLVAIIATGLALSGRTVTDGFLRAETIAQTPAPQVDEIAVALRNPGSHQRVGLPDFVWASGAPEM